MRIITAHFWLSMFGYYVINTHHGGRHRATQDEGNRGTFGEEKALESDLGTAGFRYSCEEVGATAQQRTGWLNVVCGLYCTDSDKT